MTALETPKKSIRNKKHIWLGIGAVAIALILVGAVLFHIHSMNILRRDIEEEQAQKELMAQRVQEIEEKLNVTIDEKNGLLLQIDDLLKQLAVEEVKVDAAAIMEEIQEIGELATIEYRYTNASTIDSSKKMWFTNWTLPLTTKTAVITMDGILKAGIEVKDVKITSNALTKTITVSVPAAHILSNELLEDTLQVYDEKNGIFNKLTIADGSTLRKELKAKAETNATDSGILTQAEDNAKAIIRCIIEAAPAVKDKYTIVFR